MAAGLAAWVGIGQFASLEEASENTVRWKRHYTPNATNTSFYREATERWREAYAAQRGLVDRGVTQPMWKAPGL